MKTLRAPAALAVFALSLPWMAPTRLLADGAGAEPPAFLQFFEHDAAIVPDPGWTHDSRLQDRLERALADLGADPLVESGRLGVALVDLRSPEQPRLAEVNGTEMLYAASLPKLAVLHAAFQAQRDGRLEIDGHLRDTLTSMIRVSSNSAASEAIQALGFPYIASVLWQSGSYDPDLGGGLWVGKAFGGVNDRWHRDPVANTSHGANALALVRTLTLIEQERLVDPGSSREMKRILSNPGIHHKFVKGLERERPGSVVYRKSGSWRRWHGDAALVERGPVRYAAAALCESEEGSALLERLIVELDDCVTARDETPGTTGALVAGL